VTTIYHPLSCDCLIEVENAKYIKRCNLHVRSPNVRICYNHNLAFSNKSTDEKINRANLIAEKKRIRQLPRTIV